MKQFKFIMVLLLVANSSLWAQNPDIQNTYPVPPTSKQLMFYIQRSMNFNTIAYELNYDKNGSLDESSPIHPYWIRYEEGGQNKELTYIEKRFAYGIECKKEEGSQSYQLNLVSYPLNMVLRKSGNDDYKVFITVNEREMILNHVYFKTEGGSFWSPRVKYFDIYGIDVNTRKQVVERIKP